MNEYFPWKWEYLCLILQSSEGGREDKSVVVSLEVGTIFLLLAM